jgi:hypothetical protein
VIQLGIYFSILFWIFLSSLFCPPGSERRPGNSSRSRAKHDVEKGRRRSWGQDVPCNTLIVVRLDTGINYLFFGCLE